MTTRGPSTSRLRVRYCETDAMGIAHHAEYLAWYEVARTDWIRREGDVAGEHSYRRMELAGWFLPVVEVASRHHASARYDDELLVTADLVESSRAKLAFAYTVRRVSDGALLAEGRTVHAVTGRDGRARRMPQALLDWLLGTGSFPEG
jgi:acyl-CoA thioester hydrolase